jgi:hypothetical protein
MKMILKVRLVKQNGREINNGGDSNFAKYKIIIIYTFAFLFACLSVHYLSLIS